MTERAQPGAIKSLARNDETAQIVGQLTGQFNDGWVVDPTDPTPAARRRSDIDETALDAFALKNVSASSLSVTVTPGEAFPSGWICKDTSTTVSLPPNETSLIVATHDIDEIYDPSVDPDRDAADSVTVDRTANVGSAEIIPRVRLHQVTTDGSGVIETSDLRDIGPTLGDDVAIHDSVARQFNELAIELAETQFDIGLKRLDYRNGVFDTFADSSLADSLNSVKVNTSTDNLELDGADSGEAVYPDPDDTFVPDSAVLSVSGTVPDNSTFELELVDENGNTVTISEQDEDTEVSTSSLATANFEVRFRLIRDPGVSTPEIDDFAVYLDGDITAVFDATINNTTES